MRYGLLLLAWIALAQEEPRPQVISVCELLRDRLAFDDKMVAVRGVDGYNVHGMSLIGEDCPNAIVAKDYAFRNEIWLEPATYWNRQPALQYGHGDVDFQEDPEAWNAFAPGEREWRARSKRKFRVTVVGKFITLREFRVLHYKNGTSLALGFGAAPSNTPGLLIVKSVLDGELE